MPTLGYFHTNYWAISDTTAAPVHIGRGGYPLWQASVVASSLPLGPLGLWIDAMVAKIGWWRRLVRDVYRLSVNRRADVRDFVDRMLAGKSPTPGVITKVVNRVVEKPVEVIHEKLVEKVVEVPGALEQRIAALDRERQEVVFRSLALLESPTYDTARRAVRATAQTVGLNRPEAWKNLSRELKDSPGRAENTFRHLRACSLLKQEHTSTLTNPELHLAVELAYQGFSAIGR